MKDILPLLKPKKINSNKIHLGPCSDGGYVINEIVLEHCSALFTYGVAQDYRYELDFNEKYKKPVYMFDHTVDHDLNGPLFFFKEGLGFTENCKDVIEHYNKNNIPGNIYLKIDTEGAEYDYFSKVDIDRLASFTDGICLEVHSLGNENCRNKCFEILTIINKHFTMTHIHGNNIGTLFELQGYKVPITLELSFVNKRLISHEEIDTAKYPIKDLDCSNNRNAVDYDLDFINAL